VKQKVTEEVMPNQYNAASLTEGQYPHASGLHTASGVFPDMPSNNLVSAPGASAAMTTYGSVAVVDESVARRPKVSASGVGGANSVSIAGAFTGGTGSSSVIDRDDAAFVYHQDPYSSGVTV